jgi:L-alanine-DL-glutamate epimerase-like enolase superfamily enzyme
MKITDLKTYLVSVPYSHTEVSSRVQRGGVTAVIVRIECDNGLVGWGESTVGPDAATIELAVQSARPFLLGASPWSGEAISSQFNHTALWDHRPMSANFAFAGIDQALWDLCGKEVGQPIYQLLGGARRSEVDYFCYLAQGSPDDLRQQCQLGVDRGHSCFYLKVGIDRAAETDMLAAIRETIGPAGKIRIDANQAWTVGEARSILADWHSRFEIDFVEAPVAIQPLENTLDLKNQTAVRICANEGLWTVPEAYRLIKSRCAEVLCFSSYWTGSLRSFHQLCQVAHLESQLVCKHTHGELGLAAAAGQHVMLSIPNASDGVQQTAAMMEDDILTDPLPIASQATWGLIEQPGLGVDVDEQKLEKYSELYREIGQFLPYGEDK